MNCDTCETTFEQYDAEWTDGHESQTGLRLTCPNCGDLLRLYPLEPTPVQEPLPITE